MRVIADAVEHTIEIHQSIFIAKLWKIKTKQEVNHYLTQIKKEYKDAHHYCYAYILEQERKSSDDGEPGGTAGVPIMEVLLKQELTNILCIVIRYFGGIKLGAGGLIRAYTKAVTSAFSKARYCHLVAGYQIEVVIDYSEQRKLESLLDISSYQKQYKDRVFYLIEVLPAILDKLTQANIDYKMIRPTLLEIPEK